VGDLPLVSLESAQGAPLRRALEGAGGTAKTGLITLLELAVRIRALSAGWRGGPSTNGGDEEMPKYRVAFVRGCQESGKSTLLPWLIKHGVTEIEVREEAPEIILKLN